jgi:hypothetical protein
MYLYVHIHTEKQNIYAMLIYIYRINNIIYLGMSEIYNIMSENNIQAYTILYCIPWTCLEKKSANPDRVSGPVAGSMTSPSDLSVGLGHHKWG